MSKKDKMKKNNVLNEEKLEEKETPEADKKEEKTSEADKEEEKAPEADKEEEEAPEADKTEEEAPEADKTEEETKEKAPEADKTEEETKEKAPEADKKEEKTETSKAESKEKEVLEQDKKVYKDPSVEAYKAKKKKKVKIALFSTIGVVLCLAAIYVIGVFKEMDKMHENTKINGVDVSKMTCKEAKKALLEDANKYSLKLIFKDSEYEINCDGEIITANLGDEVKDYIDKNNPYIWFLNINKKYNYNCTYTYTVDKEKLKKKLLSLPEFDKEKATKSVDAVVKFENGSVVLVEDITGTAIDEEKIFDKIAEAIDNNEDEFNLIDNECYIMADITADSNVIKKAKDEAEKYLDIKAVYNYNNEKIQISKEELAKMAYIDSKGEVGINKKKVLDYVLSIKDKFEPKNSISKSVSFTTHDGRNIDITTSKKNWIFDPEADAEDLTEYLSQKKDFEKEPIYVTKDSKMGSNFDVGGDYIEISLGEQHVYIYKEGQMVFDTPCVSGCVTSGNSTPGGLYRIFNKEADTYLVGPTWRSYVSYWMPFNGGIGLHDATWRDEFGGNIYYNGGSHGCVNLPHDAAGEIYNLIYVGMPVVAYWD